VRHLLDIARHLCGAGSAGLSVLRDDRGDRTVVHWQAVSGALADHEAIDTPRDHSPCGLCLDTGISILITRPARMFDQFSAMPPSIAEVLIVPLLDHTRRPLGTLWVAHHDANVHFHGDHVRIVEQLAAQLVLALKLQEQASDREQAEIDNRQALRFKDAMIDEVNHRTKNTLQVASTLLSLQAQATASVEVREALQDGIARLQLLAKVHELLNVNVDREQSVLMPQLMQSLGHALRRPVAHVALEIECDPMELPTQDAVALALLANEAITNAYKHAFPNEAPGVIMVKLQRLRTRAVMLRIEDTGIGLVLPDSGEGMGLALIRTFAAQLRGTLNMAGRGAGMGTLITLNIDASVNR
jgi:two-component sensor histidine kinase